MILHSSNEFIAQLYQMILYSLDKLIIPDVIEESDPEQFAFVQFTVPFAI